ncbi:hypothetical protein QBC34DRAFT_458734 [Podospora aff. communis PSN243]|uniref:Uncharacterized protein n=1 Tax=Podospora aff. communis PSN243 TaxID=3040156 RepID=A0AAV9GT82_9PEZI|nr:hypothetical protein QBC34DRAFT_458734 [Podospora aff. communis PSN243]
MGQPRKRVRAVLTSRLLQAAMALSVIPLVTNILLLLTGRYQAPDPVRPGTQRIGLSSLSIASFNGIIPSSTSHSYLVHIQLFPNAVTWSYPTSPDPKTTSGILQSGFSSSMDTYALIQRLPCILSLPRSDTVCLSEPQSSTAGSIKPRCLP